MQELTDETSPRHRSSVLEKCTLYVAWLSYALQVNPPYYVKLVELVPHPETAAIVMDTTHALMTKVKILDYANLRDANK